MESSEEMEAIEAQVPPQRFGGGADTGTYFRSVHSRCGVQAGSFLWPPKAPALATIVFFSLSPFLCSSSMRAAGYIGWLFQDGQKSVFDWG